MAPPDSPPPVLATPSPPLVPEVGPVVAAEVVAAEVVVEDAVEEDTVEEDAVEEDAVEEAVLEVVQATVGTTRPAASEFSRASLEAA